MNSRRSRVAFPLLAYAFTAIMIGTTLPTPMYAMYSAKMEFSVLTTTVVFATYAGGVLAALSGDGPLVRRGRSRPRTACWKYSTGHIPHSALVPNATATSQGGPTSNTESFGRRGPVSTW
jgi:hypothetical protein